MTYTYSLQFLLSLSLSLSLFGYLILLWNMTPQPQYEVYQVLNEVYQIQAPSLGRYEDRGTQEEQLRKFGENIIESGYFKNLVSEQVACEVTYTIDDYLTLLSTLSSYIVLDSQKRDSLFAGLRKALEKSCGNSIQVSYLSGFQIAKKI